MGEMIFPRPTDPLLLTHLLHQSDWAARGIAGNNHWRRLQAGQVLLCGVNKGCVAPGRTQHSVQHMTSSILYSEVRKGLVGIIGPATADLASHTVSDHDQHHGVENRRQKSNPTLQGRQRVDV